MQLKRPAAWMALVTVMIFLTLGQAYGEPRYDLHGDLVHPGAEEFAGVFDGIGAAPEEGEKSQLVLVNDRTFTVDQDAIFRTLSGAKTTLASFEKGMPVRFFALDNLLTNMWAVDPEKREGEQQASVVSEGGPKAEPATKPDGAPRLEDGVWKN